MNPKVALIIDDTPDNQDILALLLEKEAFEYKLVSDPRKLSSALEGSVDFGVVFLDLEMPGLDGYQVLEILKANPDFSGVPIVAYSVHVSELDAAYRQGFDSFIGKPLNDDKFPSQLDRILNGEGVWETM
jgi:CheY-like chemotaxis protein